MKELSVPMPHIRPKTLVLYLIISLSTATMLLPFVWMLSSSLKAEFEVFRFPIQWIPRDFVWSNYGDVWRTIDFGRYYLNSLQLLVAATALQVATSSLAGYAFAKIPFPERNVLFLGYLATLMIPIQVIMVPQFMVMRGLGLINSLWGLSLVLAFNPFGVFLFRQFFSAIPNELSESARLDGLNEFGIYRRIILPLSKPAIAALTIFTSVVVWNDFLASLIYLNSPAKRTVQLGIRSFVSQYSTEYALIMAASVMSLLPVVAIFVVAQRSFVEGVAMSGLKG